MERKIKCRYCQKEFTAKRIDAKYCGNSCRQMGYRRESNPDIYGKVVPIFFDLDAEDYENLLIKADEEGMHPNEFAKDFLLRKEENYLRLYLEDNDWTYCLNNLEVFFPDSSIEKLLHDWLLERVKKEAHCL